jgi:hypothetical protein
MAATKKYRKDRSGGILSRIRFETFLEISALAFEGITVQIEPNTLLLTTKWL